jgi:nucleoside-diphosphate-sugar epimerase
MEVLVSRALPRSVLVTGATGFLGGHVCRTLAERGMVVRALVRRPGSLTAGGVEPWPARGLDDAPALRAGLAGVDAVVHLAAHVHRRRVPMNGSTAAAAFHAVNVEGTRALLDAAVAAGVRDFVFVSSVKAVGEQAEVPWTEATPARPADAYGVSKLEAERLVRERADRHGLHAPVLRLPLVYGPGMKANALRLFAAVARGTPLPLGAVRNRRSLLFTGNLVAALLATLESPSGGDTFFVSDGEDLSTPDLVREIARGLGRPARLLPVPVGALRAAGRIGDVLARMAPWPLTTEAVDRLVGSLAVDPSKLKRLTGYRPPYGVREGLGITARWYLRRLRGME